MAGAFGKDHSKVLRAIKGLDCSDSFTLANFVLSEHTDSTGRKLPMFEMTKDGWAFLVMGFTGKKAAKFKPGEMDENFRGMRTCAYRHIHKYRL